MISALVKRVAARVLPTPKDKNDNDPTWTGSEDFIGADGLAYVRLGQSREGPHVVLPALAED